MQTVREERSFTALFSDLTREMTDLFRKEVELAKVELSGKMSEAETGLISLAIGGGIIAAGSLVLLSGLVLGIAEMMEWDSPWLAAFIVGIAVILIGFALLQRGRHKMRDQSFIPQRSAESLRKDKNLIKEKANEVTGRQPQF